ncbi:adenylate kinase [uncultured Acetobacteroides sp.]|uniref:adenylate kinase n=1 Tax=uncultured Acetobacteroides sp. TaxID=1760811 RepID=UPI0029F5664A|nr:adenylate kinase [uncultured Acetobacteroides sp.]
MLNVVLFGAPGAGKGTQADLLAKEFGLIHLSTGDMLREEIAKGTELGMRAKSIEGGNFAPDEVVITLLENAVRENRHGNGFVFDGFPRTIAQVDVLDVILASVGSSVTMMVSLDVAESELVQRLLKRGEESHRLDDRNIDIIKKRIGIYHERTEAVMDLYKLAGKYHAVDGIGTLDEILNRIKEQVGVAASK